MTAFSILDLAPITLGSTPRDSLHRSKDLIQHAEAWGYKRHWVAEHHNMQGIASSATSIVIGYLAEATKTIRVGAGGIMLPNHAPLVIAEQFGTLASLYPDRIDLGLGRAPGTDQLTMQALRRNLQAKIDDFPRDVVELQSFLKEAQPNQSITAVPGVGTNVPLWILGSSLFGAQLAAMLGLPFAFASHFAPAYMQAAIDMYRDRFQPSEQLQVPYIMLGFNLCAAESSTEASYLRSSSLQSFINLRRGQPGPLPPPIEDFDNQMSVSEQQMLSEISHCSAIGDADMVEQQIQQFIDRTGADELMIVSSMFDHHKRLQSYEIGAEIMKRLPSHSKPDTASA